MRLLLVEDSERLQRSLSTGLRRAGYAVDTAGSGADGLWRASSIDYDVVILDVMLPGIDGLSVLRQLRENRDRNAPYRRADERRGRLGRLRVAPQD